MELEQTYHCDQRASWEFFPRMGEFFPNFVLDKFSARLCAPPPLRTHCEYTWYDVAGIDLYGATHGTIVRRFAFIVLFKDR